MTDEPCACEWIQSKDGSQVLNPCIAHALVAGIPYLERMIRPPPPPPEPPEELGP